MMMVGGGLFITIIVGYITWNLFYPVVKWWHEKFLPMVIAITILIIIGIVLIAGILKLFGWLTGG